jgi:hypothetical protein
VRLVFPAIRSIIGIASFGVVPGDLFVLARLGGEVGNDFRWDGCISTQSLLHGKYQSICRLARLRASRRVLFVVPVAALRL